MMNASLGCEPVDSVLGVERESLVARARRRMSDVGHALGYAARARSFLVVMGMHRSGTSCITRTLSLMGASLGPVSRELEKLTLEEDHWESPSLNWINDEILRRSAGTWWEPPATLAPSWLDHWRCRRFLWEFSDGPIGVFKDPRLCMTYPVWRAALPHHRVIACIRHPVNVARSLQKREGWPLEQGLRLWVTYNQRMLEVIGENGDVLWYDFDRGREGIERLVGRMRHEGVLSSGGEALAHYNPAEHHHRGEGDAPLGSQIAELYATLKERERRSNDRAADAPERGERSMKECQA